MAEKATYTAADLLPGDKAKVVKISGKASLRRKLLDMGIVSGTSIELIRHAPLGDPVQIKIKGYHLSLRKSEASHIFIKKAK